MKASINEFEISIKFCVFLITILIFFKKKIFWVIITLFAFFKYQLIFHRTFYKKKIISSIPCTPLLSRRFTVTEHIYSTV
jgi:hypothetical protein